MPGDEDHDRSTTPSTGVTTPDPSAADLGMVERKRSALPRYAQPTTSSVRRFGKHAGKLTVRAAPPPWP